MDRESGLERLGWWCGGASAALILVGFFMIDEGGSASSDSPAVVLAGEITSQHGRIVIGSVVGMLGGTALAGFIAALRARLAREGPRGEMLGSAGYAFGVVARAGAFLHGSFRLANATVTDTAVLAEAIRPLAIVSGQISGVMFWGLLGLVAIMSWVSFVTGLLPRLLGFVGAALIVGTIALVATDHGGVSLALLPWLTVACILLLRGDRAATP